MDADTAPVRALKAGRELDRIESQPLAFFQKVRQGYLDLAASAPDRIHVLDATLTQDTLHQHIWSLVAPRIHAL